jgi:hypothetical protein
VSEGHGVGRALILEKTQFVDWEALAMRSKALHLASLFSII